MSTAFLDSFRMLALSALVGAWGALGCSKSEAPVANESSKVAAAPSPVTKVVVQLGYQKIGVGYVGETTPIFAQGGGHPWSTSRRIPLRPKAEAIIARKDSPIQSLADLKGKKIALNRGSNVHYLLLQALEKA